ncbi:MAG: adenylate/guanylate cyclase domain-containing protein [Dongiaceae bacterium]
MDIAAWLAALGLERYEEAFRENEIDPSVLPNLTVDDLKDLGVGIVGHRRKLLEAIAGLKAASAGVATVSPHLLAGAAPQRDAERRQLTLMFIDLVGSTALSAKLDPEDMREVIRLYQNTVAGEIARFEGHIAKFMGDGVLAYFGWPRAHEDEAERAVRAGLAVTESVSRLRAPGGETLQTRVGIATGLVVVGDLIGEGAAQEQTVVGDTPNLAARLQSAAEPNTVVIADSTRHLVGDLFLLRALGSQSFKGIVEPVTAFAVLGERAVESRFAARRTSGMAPIVARDQELALLMERWRQTKSGEGQMVLLSGEAGIGKSRIAEALIDALRAEPHFLLRYQCSPYHIDSALYPAIQQLTHAAGFIPGDALDVRLDRLEALLAKATDDIGEAAPLIAALIGLDAEPRYGPIRLAPQQRRNRTLAVLIDQLIGLAGRKPALWVIEDAHWIDPTTLELIELALDRIQTARVFVLLTARPTFVASFGSHPVVTRLALNRLGREATQSIIDRITGGKRLPVTLLDEIISKTDGVPLFVEEMTKAVIESDMLRDGVDAYYLDKPVSALAIPTTLHDSLMARLDRLQPVKEVAQIGAVIGRSFDHRTIAALAGRPEGELIDAMRQLVEAELVFRRGIPPDATYLFKHALVRDAAYESLLKAKRLMLHARLLEILEDRVEAAPEVMAQHAEAADLPERALNYWELAGSQALARSAYKEAIANLENGVRLCSAIGEARERHAREQKLQLQLGQALIADQGYAFPETLRAFDRALELAQEIGDVSSQLPALWGQWAAFHIVGTGSPELAQRFAALAEMQPESGPRLVGYRMLALERLSEGRLREALVLIEKALESYDPAVHRDLLHRFGHDPRTAAANYKSWILWHMGFPDQAASTMEANLRWARDLNHANTMGIALCYGVTLVNIWLRRPDQVERAAREALRLADEMSMAQWRAWSLIHLGWAMSQQDAASGLEEMEAGLREARQISVGRLEPLHLGLLADAYSRAGRHGEAEARIAKALEVLANSQHITFAAELHRMKGVIALRATGLSGGEAGTDFRQAMEIAAQQQALSPKLRAARDLARLLGDTGERQQAADLLTPIYDAMTEGFDTPDLIEARTLLDELRG